MSNFYARYLPPAKKAANTTKSKAKFNTSTKRKLPERDLALREPKKPRSAGEAELKKDDFGVKRFVPKEKKSNNEQEGTPTLDVTPPQSQTAWATSGGRDVLDRYRVTGATKKNITEADVILRKPVQKDTFSKLDQSVPEPTKELKAKKNQKKQRDNPDKENEGLVLINHIVNLSDKASEDAFEKHTVVRDRFKNAKRKSEQHDDQLYKDNQETPKQELHGLEPLPQPLEVEQPYEPPSYSTLPPWLARADHISQDTEVAFASLGVSETVLKNLMTKGLQKAMPIQSAVIPLLSRGPTKHDGDLAVAAATGSGKTLAYVLPIVEALKELVVTKLRGVIVVPTRDLVKQVQETFNMYTEGTNLRAATALGSRSVKEEADALVESYDVYDPETYAEKQSKEVDWEDFSPVELFDRAKHATSQAVNHVTKYRSKVDVLICTPGRLVEHLQSTRGFTLDDVQWLVVDEVDRLLNESYQEWLEVVMPVLQSRAATEVRDKVLQDMGMELPPRLITKVILSATMTQDLSKLNSLNLRNPRLLTLEHEDLEQIQNTTDAHGEAAEPNSDATGAFQLPGSLTETAVVVGDGSDKPLHLLELLRTRIAKAEKPMANGATAHGSDTSGSVLSDDSSSSSSDTDPDSSNSSTSAQQNGVEHSSPISAKYSSTLIFTRSTSAAPRLSRLLNLLSPDMASQIAVLTRSTTSSASSRRSLKSFRTGAISILITTDRAARGLDISNIEHVINYDVPSSVQFYVHRVGRTARAGKIGRAWTLLAHREGRWFDQEIARGEQVRRNGKVSKITLEGVGTAKDVRRKYDEALMQLGEEVEGK